jgi:cobalt-zinc-cadmium efflux system protein
MHGHAPAPPQAQAHVHSHGAGSATRAFAIVTLANLAYTAVEAGYGFSTDSLALLSDALHNLGDVLGLGLAWGAAAMARRAPTDRHTYGWRRATLLSPLANAVLLVAFAGALSWEALRRFGAPPQIPAMPVIVVAAIGIVVNLGGAWLLRDAFNAAMDAVPSGLDQAEVRAWLLGQDGVEAVHHLHIWSLGAGEVAMTAHLVRATGEDHDAFLDRVHHGLDDTFGINHPTLQVEFGAACGHDRHDRAPHAH